MYVMKGLRKKRDTIKGSGLWDHYWIGYSLSVEKLFNCHLGGLHVIEPFQLPLLWHNEPKIITVGQKKPPQCLTQSIKCTKCIKGLIYLVQHLSPKMLAHCRDSLVWLSLQCHLSNTKQIWVKFLSGNVYVYWVMYKQTFQKFLTL